MGCYRASCRGKSLTPRFAAEAVPPSIKDAQNGPAWCSTTAATAAADFDRLAGRRRFDETIHLEIDHLRRGDGRWSSIDRSRFPSAVFSSFRRPTHDPTAWGMLDDTHEGADAREARPVTGVRSAGEVPLKVCSHLCLLHSRREGSYVSPPGRPRFERSWWWNEERWGQSWSRSCPVKSG